MEESVPCLEIMTYLWRKQDLIVKDPQPTPNFRTKVLLLLLQLKQIILKAKKKKKKNEIPNPTQFFFLSL